jgi:hypothetical protein
LEQYFAQQRGGTVLGNHAHDVAEPGFTALFDTKIANSKGQLSGGHFAAARKHHVAKMFGVPHFDVVYSPSSIKGAIWHLRNGALELRNPNLNSHDWFRTNNEEELHQEITRRIGVPSTGKTLSQLRLADQKVKAAWVDHVHAFDPTNFPFEEQAVTVRINERIRSLKGRTPSPQARIKKAFRGMRIRKAISFGAASPNVDELSFDEALRRLKSEGHAAFRNAAVAMIKKVGMNGDVHDALSDWSDGAENSLAHFFTGPVDDEKLTYLLAWLGKLGRQKSVVKFLPSPSGKHFLHDVTVPEQDLGTIRHKLDTLKVPFRSLLPKGNSTRVLVIDQAEGLAEPMNRFAKGYNVKVLISSCWPSMVPKSFTTWE